MELTGELLKVSAEQPVTATKPVVSVASGVVVKFPSITNNSRRVRQRRATVNKKLRREFFEHDTRKGTATGNQMKWPENGGGVVVTAPPPPGTTALTGGSDFGTGTAEKMNSKARRAAKFREMKVLQRIMLSKDIDIAQLLPSITTAATAITATNNSCCNCKCGTTRTASHNSVASATIGSKSVPSTEMGLGGGGTMVMTEKEVFKCCSVR